VGIIIVNQISIYLLVGIIIDIWLVCEGEVLFKSILFKTILIIRQFCMAMKVMAWYIDPNVTEITKPLNIHTPMFIKIM
jgi:hypothetical protein